jgi:hypothetical protein
MKTKLLGVLTLVLVAACDPGGTACTQIGCDDQLTLTFVNENGDPITDLAGELEFDGQTLAFDCGDPDGSSTVHCDGNQLTVYAAPSQITIAATGATHEAYKTVSATYETVQPNGPDCPPTCKQATETVSTNALSEDP